MPLFVCDKCKCIENTALSPIYWFEQKRLCSECHKGKWHGKFKKEIFDPNKWEYESGDFVKEK